MKLYAVRLLATAIINRVPVSPVEGIQMVTREDRDRLVENKQAEDAEADVDNGEAADAPFDPSPFSVEAKSGGNYTITGPGLDVPEKVKGKANMEARVGALIAKLPPSDDLDGKDTAALRETAETEKVEIADDADDDALRAAIRKARADKA